MPYLRLISISLLSLVLACGSETDPAGGTGTSTGGTSSGGTSSGGMGGGGETSTGGNTGAGGSSGGTGGAGGTIDTSWAAPITLVDDLGRLAVGNQVHVVGHIGSDLVHRTSADDGATWSNPTVIGSANNFPGMYGGLHAEGDNVFLMTGDGGDMASGPRAIDFWRSSDNGANWTSPVRVTGSGETLFRGRIAASGNYVHVVGVQDPTPVGNVIYFRSLDGGATWENSVELAGNLGEYGGGQTVAVDGATVHVAYTEAVSGVGAGPTYYIRSADNGATWSAPTVIGEASAESSRQARVQIAAADGRVFACWQREGAFTGAPLPEDRIGYNRSDDGGLTWGTAQVLPGDTGINRNHQQLWMAAGGGVHIGWRHGNTTTDDDAGYIFSSDYGATWGASVIAIDTSDINHPFSLVADATAAHFLTSPDTGMQYAYRLLAP